jgi:hypothetical protein
MSFDMSTVDRTRQQAGFLCVEELMELHGSENTILDPFSTLISQGIVLGSDNIIYPGAVIARHGESIFEIGTGNSFYPGTFLLADNGGQLSIGDHNQFGDGGVRMKANMPAARIRVRDYGRFVGGPEVVGISYLGGGAQIIGAITVQDCSLEDGEPFTAPDPNARGAVLKGFGVARGLHLSKGDVVNGSGSFASSPVERQITYHK